MSIELKEYIGSSVNAKESVVKGPVNLTESMNDIGPIKKGSIIQLIEGIHVGPTRNYTWYKEEALKTSIPTWTKPYQRPLIMHHNEKDGKIIGRILNVEYRANGTRSGTPALVYTCHVPDKEGMEQILDGRLKTVSIGVIAHDVRCSICGEQVEIIDEYGSTACGHDKGQVYGGKICYWEIHKMEAKELSYVIVPSDIYAHNLETYKAEDFNKKFLKESNNNEGVAINMAEAIKEGKVKSTIIDEEVKGNVDAPIADAKPEEPVNEENKPTEDPAEEPKKEENKEPEIDPKDKEIAELKAKVETLEKEKEELKGNVDSIKTDLEAANTKADEMSKKLETEVQLKEAVEDELAKAKVQIRESKEAEFNVLRQALNKPVIVKESLSKRSDESLMDAILDLKEEMGSVTNVKNITEANRPSLDDETEKNKINTNVDVKEAETASNINVEESLKNIFSTMLNPSSYF